MGKHEKQVDLKKEIISWVISIAIAVAIALVLRFFVFEIVQVDGISMEPTLSSHESLFVEKVTRYFGNIERGQIVIVQYPTFKEPCVKRIIGLPGDTIEVTEGKVFLNGAALTEPYINDQNIKSEVRLITVPPNTYYVMGDNRNNSTDSRNNTVGPIPNDKLIGHALFIIWPPGNIAGLTQIVIK